MCCQKYHYIGNNYEHFFVGGESIVVGLGEKIYVLKIVKQVVRLAALAGRDLINVLFSFAKKNRN